jgi:uncharacterized membrane protein YqaE (UPF0057 family)
MSKLLHDPLSLHSPYPWIWFAPVAIALHYGLLASQFSIFLLLFDYLYKDTSPLFTIDFQLFVLGGFVMTMICAIWQNSWAKKIAYNKGVSNYLQQRIQNIAYSYKLISLAYKRLENNYIAQPVTIRTSMNELRQMLGHMDASSEAEIFKRLINILAIHCSLETAAIFPVKNNKVIPEAITSIGTIIQPSNDNYFIKHCIENATLTHMTADEILKGHQSDYVIGAPLIDHHNKIYALLLIEELPFLSLNDENIATINLLLQYFIEGNMVKNAEAILHQFPDCSVSFANELQRLFNLERKIKKDSTLVAFKILDEEHVEDYVFRLKQEIRGLDSWWVTRYNTIEVLMVLMPFTNRAAMESYKLRIDDILMKEYRFRLNQKEIKFNSYQLSTGRNPIQIIEALLNL